MTTDQARQVIYVEMDGWIIEDWPKTITPDGSKTYGLPDPAEDTEAGLAEFARVLLWGWDNFSLTQITQSAIFRFAERRDSPVGKQEAILLSIAAAIVARREGTT